MSYLLFVSFGFDVQPPTFLVSSGYISLYDSRFNSSLVLSLMCRTVTEYYRRYEITNFLKTLQLAKVLCPVRIQSFPDGL